MNINFGPRGTLQIDDAVITYRNFAGRADKYNREGDRNFAVIIPDQETADKLINDLNKYGVGWNVKIRPPRDEDDSPFIYMGVKIRFNDRGPKVFLKSGNRTIRLSEETVARLDDIDILSVDLDIRPYDDMINGKPFRAAYLEGIWVTQRTHRFETRFAEEEYPED